MCNTCDNINSQPTKFVNLHVHSCYSLLDGLSKPEDIVKKIKSMGQSSFAITEHGNVFSSVKAHKLAKENSLKHIYGIEFYVCPDRLEKSKYNHLTVLAANEKGRKNINELSSLGFLEGFYNKPRVDHELLKKYKEGLIVLSGCMASEFQQALAGGKIGDDDVEITEKNINEAKGVAKFYREMFGKNYFLEVQSHSDKRQQKLNRAVVDIANDLNIPYVVTADSHFVDEEDHELHSIFIQIGQNREAGETYMDGQLQSEHEARRLLKPALTDEEIEEAIRNTSVIADMCNVDLPLSAPIIPHVDVPKHFKTEAEYLKHLCREGWKKRGIHKLPNVNEYKDRLKFEFDAITNMEFEGYYLLVESYANSVERRGIARGSGGGSLVAYLLNIVNIDPIKYGLYFERFIDVGALDLLKNNIITKKELKIPDFDLDFGRMDRDIVIESIINRYGEDKFVSLGQFGLMWDKAAIKDVGKVLGIDFSVTNKITKELGDDDLQDAIDDGRLKDYEKQYPKLFEYAKKISGTPKSFGIHPCGKAVTISGLTDYTAITKSDDTILFQGDMHDAEDLGIVKIDTLGLRTIDVIHDTLNDIGKNDEYIDPNTLNFEDKNVLKIFQEGTTEGMFQFESEGMKQTLRKMKPNGLSDLGVANALYRPGSMKFIDDYVRRKNGEEDVVFLHEDLKDILNVTYGIIVFQEQLIEIGRLAKMRNPDLLRKATGKKDVKLLEKVKPELVEGLANRGWSEEPIEELWSVMLDFAKYSFNKSHSYAYAMIAYITAFLKTYHPREFIAALLNSYIDGGGQDKFEHIEKIFGEAKRLRITVRLPEHLSEFNDKCFVKGEEVIYGLHLVKQMNAQTPTSLKSLADMKFKTFTEFLIYLDEESDVTDGHVGILTELGVFKQFGSIGKVSAVFKNVKEGKNRYKKSHVQKTKEKRIPLLIEEELNIKEEEIPFNKKLMIEVTHLGFPISTSPTASNKHCVVTNINSKYTPVVSFYKIKTGEVIKAKIKKKTFYTNKGDLVDVGDMVIIKSTFRDYRWKPNPDYPDSSRKQFYQDKSLPQELFVSSLTQIK
ncbi:DNA polymerase III subunit alpha [Halobacillus litoralis]|uniref:DNA polymerase III subunit alpha n=1 Tax=Halobacillus litoralis TaxID=45668 RepID=UPI001CD46FA5|nr:DNA polymerase III subunit alpha [Halobacillus litoralis]MCA1021470.1 DNA polymerase III subunit alpha [Halobacillus litoralis]